MKSISITQSKHLQAIAILMMLCLHLFNRDYHGLFEPLLFIGNQPLSYYISLFSDACVPIFAFVSGYGLYFKYANKPESYTVDNRHRLKKLYLNYWVILILFVLILGTILGKEGYPGSWQKFAIAFTGLQPTYNGAWWFFTTYVFFVLTSKLWFKLMELVNPYIYIFLLLSLYVIGFYFRIYKSSTSENFIVNYTHTQLALYFCTLFQFMLGAFALKYKWNEKISAINQSIINNWTLGIGMVLLVIFHAFFTNFIIAPFTALGFIFLFTQLKLPLFMHKTLDFLSPHSTNLWLIHMFFYLIYFSNFIYSFKYPILIYLVLVILCVLSSYVVNYLLQITRRME